VICPEHGYGSDFWKMPKYSGTARWESDSSNGPGNFLVSGLVEGGTSGVASRAMLQLNKVVVTMSETVLFTPFCGDQFQGRNLLIVH